VLLPELRREAGEILESVAADPAKILGDEWGFQTLIGPNLPDPSVTT
jgi:hypothetical protein